MQSSPIYNYLSAHEATKFYIDSNPIPQEEFELDKEVPYFPGSNT